MPNSIHKSKLRWQCRRGMLELDVMLGRFLELTFPDLTNVQQHQFEKMLTADDPTLYAWLIGAELPVDKEMHDIVVRCRRNEAVESIN
jgi:antitoxin CptB